MERGWGGGEWRKEEQEGNGGGGRWVGIVDSVEFQEVSTLGKKRGREERQKSGGRREEWRRK